jgi:hypothetical protein
VYLSVAKLCVETRRFTELYLFSLFLSRKHSTAKWFHLSTEIFYKYGTMKHLLVHVHYSITTGDADQELEQLHHDPDGAVQGPQHPHLPRRNEVTRQSVFRIRILIRIRIGIQIRIQIGIQIRIRRIRMILGLLNPDPDPSIT